MNDYFVIIKIITAVLALCNGLLCFFKASLAISIQQRFYEKINWKIEPIDLAKELRNTKIMGAISIFLGTLIVLVTILRW